MRGSRHTSLRPTFVGSRIRVVPRPGLDPAPGIVDVVVGSGAFGSGEHETTASCLEVLDRLDCVDGAEVFDVGSGTGILAIAALALGARAAVCLDVAPRAAATALGNCQINRVTDRVVHVIGTLSALGAACFDLVLANVYSDVLLGQADRLAACVRPGGRLLLSGIPWQDAFVVERRYLELGFTPIRTRALEDYCTVLLQASGDGPRREPTGGSAVRAGR
jgi:ribosomal protein L11 methyltransferase